MKENERQPDLETKLDDLENSLIRGETGEECPDCGYRFQEAIVPLANRVVTITCKCFMEKQEARERELEAQQKQKQIDRVIKGMGLGPQFEGCSLENFEVRPGTENAFEAAKEYAKKIRPGGQRQWLLLFGPPGNGKTHLAAAITRQAAEKGLSVIFERVPLLLSRIRRSYSDGDQYTEKDIIDALTKADLLVLDDAGKQKWTEWTEPILYTMIDNRYCAQKDTIITTNSDLETLSEKIGEAAMDRILDMAALKENTASSYRQERAKRRAAGK